MDNRRPVKGVSLISKTKSLLGDLLFLCQEGFGQYRLRYSDRKPLAVLMYHGLETDPRKLAASSHRVTPAGCLKEIRFFEKQGYGLVSADEIDGLACRKDNYAGYLLVSFDDGHANIYPHVKKWLEVEKIPVLLGICPGIVEENRIFWWEEVRARFELMRQPIIEIRNSGGKPFHFGKTDALKFEASGRAVPNHELQSRLDQLRQQTSYIGPREIKASDYVHENMSWQQIRELSKHPLCTLASHSMHHEVATQISAEEFACRTKTSLDLLAAKTGRLVRHYIYPNGSFSEETERVLAGLGIVHTYSTECALNRIPSALRLNRLHGYDLDQRSLRYYGSLWREYHANRQ